MLSRKVIGLTKLLQSQGLRLGVIVTAFGFALAFAGMRAIPLTAAQQAKPPAEASCGDYGTAIDFEATPAAAAKRAVAEEKLVMVLHVSGHFEDPGLT
ncbi:MAG: hypothetical protein RMI91_05725 [Gemmatales bacterium]|nr:hypothetical protein [Gemmatales bacterium]MDW7994134.1 hypothetical protein [Gemmatales bacterium]